MTLDSKPDAQNLTDMLAPPPDVPEEKGEGEDGMRRQAATLMYEMTEQETQLQKKEGEYGIYMSTFGYEGDDSNLGSDKESDPDMAAYPYLG